MDLHRRARAARVPVGVAFEDAPALASDAARTATLEELAEASPYGGRESLAEAFASGAIEAAVGGGAEVTAVVERLPGRRIVGEPLRAEFLLLNGRIVVLAPVGGGSYLGARRRAAEGLGILLRRLELDPLFALAGDGASETDAALKEVEGLGLRVRSFGALADEAFGRGDVVLPPTPALGAYTGRLLKSVRAVATLGALVLDALPAIVVHASPDTDAVEAVALAAALAATV